MASDSSNSDDETQRLKEAIDDKFLSNNLYFKNEIREDIISQKEELPSLRNQFHTDTKSVNPFTIKVTPEFQKHVSQYLSRALDESIEEKVVKVKKKKIKTTEVNYGGVRLLKNSKHYLEHHNNVFKTVNSKRYFHTPNKETFNFEERAKEVAVSGEWVLSQKETQHWAVNSKGEVEIIKCKNKK